VSKRSVRRARASAVRARTESRLAEVRASPAPVKVTYRCGVCGRSHPTSAHDLSPAGRRLDAGQLRALRAEVTVELARAVRHHAEDETLRRMCVLLDALDARIGEIERRDAPTVERRQRIAAEIEHRHPEIYA
jgi:hypothetical protein